MVQANLGGLDNAVLADSVKDVLYEPDKTSKAGLASFIYMSICTHPDQIPHLER